MTRVSIALFFASSVTLAIAAFTADSVGLGIASLLLPVGIWASVVRLQNRLLLDAGLVGFAALTTLSAFVGIPFAVSLPALTLAIFAWHGLIEFDELDDLESDPESKRRYSQRYGIIALSATFSLTVLLILFSRIQLSLNFGMALLLAFLAYGSLMAFLVVTGRHHRKDDPFA